MKNIQWFSSLDKNLLAYWLGLLMLFAGLSLGISIAMALSVVGGVLVFTSAASSFFLTWLSVEKK